MPAFRTRNLTSLMSQHWSRITMWTLMRSGTPCYILDADFLLETSLWICGVELTFLSTFGYSGCLQGRLVCGSRVDKSFVLRLGLAELQNSWADTIVFAYTDTEMRDETTGTHASHVIWSFKTKLWLNKFLLNFRLPVLERSGPRRWWV